MEKQFQFLNHMQHKAYGKKLHKTLQVILHSGIHRMFLEFTNPDLKEKHYILIHLKQKSRIKYDPAFLFSLTVFLVSFIHLFKWNATPWVLVFPCLCKFKNFNFAEHSTGKLNTYWH